MLTEFGGIALSREQGTWGYARSQTAEEFARRVRELLDVVRELQVFSGFCYTQFTDTYQENNGLLYADRRPKIPLEDIRDSTRGPRRYRDDVIERQWRERMLRLQAEHG